MAAPISGEAILAAFRAEGVDTEPWHDWLETDRPGPFAPNGVMVHHTGSNTSDATGRAYTRSILRPGYAGLPGPLCMAGIAPNGRVILLSRQDANHAGGGCPHVLQAVIDEASWLMQREARPTRGNRNGVDGNARFYGFEIMYSGGRPMSAAQLDQAVRATAALCRAHGWTARSVIGHREWSRDKSDPGMMSMVTFRKLVQARLDRAPEDVSVGVKRATVTSSVKAATTAVKQRTMGMGRPISYRVYKAGVESGKPSGNVKLVQAALAGQRKKDGKAYYPQAPNGIADEVHVQAVKDWQLAIGDSPSYADGRLGPLQFERLTRWAGWRPVA